MNFDLQHPEPSAGAVAQKRFLRQALLAARAALPAADRRASDRAVCNRLSSLPALQSAQKLFAYWPLEEEIDIRPIIQDALVRKIPVGLPVCQRETKELLFRCFEKAEDLIAGAYGIPTPPDGAEILTPDEHTVCIVPALAYDKKHYRIGYGGGYYDRFLADFPGIAVGVCYNASLLDTVFAEAHDQRVQILVTETDVFG